MVKRLVLAIAVAVFVAGAPVHAGVDPVNLCKQGNDKAAGKKAFDLLKAFGKNTKKSDTAKLAQDISKAKSKFTKGFSKADTLGPCPVPGDAPDVEPVVDDCADRVITLIDGGTVGVCGNGVVDSGEQCDPPDYGGATCGALGFNLDGTLGCTAACQYDVSGCEAFPATGQTTCWNSSGGVILCAGTGHDGDIRAGAPLAYMDNGDGTITDLNTGLMWAKRSDDCSIKDKDNTYTWDNAFAVHVAGLNTANFAGHSDWRVPNAKELQSIVN